MATQAARPVLLQPPPPSPGAGDRLLRDVLDREARLASGRMAVVVMLSQLPPPGARPHHRRIGRALLDDCARRHDGQVFQLRNGDLVLLARPEGARAEGERAEAAAEVSVRPVGGVGPLALPEMLNRVLHSEAGSGDGIVRAVPAREMRGHLLALLDASAGAAAPTGREEGPPVAGATLLAGQVPERVAELLRVQMGCMMPAGPSAAGIARIRPVHRRVGVDPRLMAAWLAPQGGVPEDPWLRRHMAGRLDEAMLAVLRAEWGGGGPLDRMPGPGRPPLHLGLSLGAVLSDGFAGLLALWAAAPAAAAPAAGRPGVEIELMEACADPSGFAEARRRLADAGVALVLDGIGHQALALTRPGLLGADLVKLQWSPQIARLPGHRHAEIGAAIDAVGRQKVMLCGADTETALQWGRGRGLHLFQGQHVDIMLAAARLTACPHAGGCTVRQCAERGRASLAEGRRGCGNPGLLDRGVPSVAVGREAA